MKKTAICIMTALILLIGTTPVTVLPQEKEAETEKTYGTGVYQVDGVQKYYKDGVFQNKVTAVVPRASDGKLVYVRNGVFQKKTGIVKRLSDKKWVYIKNGVFKRSTGLAKRLKDGKWLYVKKGVFKKHTGLVKRISDKKWFFVKNGICTNDVNKIYFTDADRKAKRTEAFVQTYCRALFKKITGSWMTKKQKLKACFYYAAERAYELHTIPHYQGPGWQVYYADEMIENGSSVCYGYAALFGYLANLCGYKKVYCCTDTTHAWVEVNGKVFDPTFLYSTYNIRVYNLDYPTARSVNPNVTYRLDGYSANRWMRVRINS